MNNTKIKIEIPESWKWERLEEALDFVIGGDWGKDEDFDDPNYGLAYCIRGSEIKNWDIDKGRTASLRKIKLSNIEKRKLVQGDILVEISGGGPEQPVGRTVLIDAQALSYNSEIPKICTNFLRLIRPKNFIDSKFLNLYLNFFYYSGEIVNYQGGSNNLRNLKFPEYIRINFPLPPKITQQAIVSKIEELFSELDKGIEQLKLAHQQLIIYRRAVLERYTENENLKSIESIVAKLDQGWSPKCENYPAGKNEWGVIKTSAVQHGYFDESENKKLPVSLAIRQQHELKAGDILITRAGPRVRVGVCCLIKHVRPKLLNCDKVYRIKVDQSIIKAEYLAAILNTPKYLGEIEKMKTGINDSGVNLTQRGFLNIRIPVPSIKEQEAIIQEIESRLSVADKMEETLNQSLQQAEALRQSILKKAFEGKLVSTDTIETIKETAKVIPLERKVLAGKIIHLLHDDKHFGLTKFQKILYLVENYTEVPYETNFLQDRAGPHDKDFTLAFRKEMQENDWLQEEQKGKITKFILGDNIGTLIKDYAVYFRNKGKKIVFVIKLLKDKSTHEAELIATLYAVWNNRLIKKKPVKIDVLIEDFFNWSPKKKEEFQPEEVVATFKWMKKTEFVPSGFGKVIGTN